MWKIGEFAKLAGVSVSTLFEMGERRKGYRESGFTVSPLDCTDYANIKPKSRKLSTVSILVKKRLPVGRFKDVYIGLCVYALKRELQLNNKEVSQMRGMAGFKRLVYNMGLELLQASWDIPGLKMGDSKRIDVIKKVFTSIQAGKRIKLPGLKRFRLKERINFICSSKTFTVSRAADKWFVSFVLDAEKIPPIIHPVERAIVDLGVKCLETVFDGTRYEMPLTKKRAKTKLSKMQWHNRNRFMGNKLLKIKASNKAKNYYTNLSRQHLRIANIRQDTTQNMTTDLSRRVYNIRIEDLNVVGMIANHKLAETVSNNCFHEIRRQLIYKQAHYGTKVELVDRWYPSSKTCSCCGHIQQMKLSDRVFNCSSCGHSQDRDKNASINLENAPPERVRLA